ncbi:RNA-binding domain-containing protein [uncultured Butyricimonas sp.]|uniref:RNA-binding domain-containing protein n=1 Tax=uncultured Butyricimonas sp. TaxID=1268785 RepID=UPI0026DB5D0C|nr:RNA-binding domain-containing protein [uncultured Butyricimonas sp.]
MALPININDLLSKNKVEGNRIEFKKGWNPSKIYHSICAFANDLDNLGGGYILLGVEEENGIAKRPVTGVSEESIDRILRDMVGFNNKIEPYYMPRTSVEEVDGKSLLVIWVPSGVNRPFSVMEDVTSKHSRPKFYIRSGSSSIEAKGEILDQLRELANRTPFDDRGNPDITLDDISPVLVYDHLKKVGSRLVKSFNAQELDKTLDQMNLYEGSTERRYLKNVTAMMFCEELQKFFPITRVEIVVFPEGRVQNPNNFYEAPVITGTVPQMIKETLNYLRTFIREYVVKLKDRAESIRYFNYPYQALEEAVVNALYHRDYQEREPVEITIEPDKVSILSYSGPDRSVTIEAIREGEVLRSRRYRNRRLGDFLKELDLTEGRSTGIPTIQDELRKNGSPRAIIETDPDRTYFLIDIPCREGVETILSTNERQGNDRVIRQSNDRVTRQSNDRVTTELIILEYCLIAHSRREILEHLNLKYHSDNYKKYIKPLVNKGYLQNTEPNSPNSPTQKFITTVLGKDLLGG